MPPGDAHAAAFFPDVANRQNRFPLQACGESMGPIARVFVDD